MLCLRQLCLLIGNRVILFASEECYQPLESSGLISELKGKFDSPLTEKWSNYFVYIRPFWAPWKRTVQRLDERTSDQRTLPPRAERPRWRRDFLKISSSILTWTSLKRSRQELNIFGATIRNLFETAESLSHGRTHANTHTLSHFLALTPTLTCCLFPIWHTPMHP